MNVSLCGQGLQPQDLMEKKELNFDAPLLSIRRYSLPANHSDTRDEETRKRLPPRRQQCQFSVNTEPVAVPFKWEEIPGTPKCGGGLPLAPQKEFSSSPRLPPGWRVPADTAQKPPKSASEDQYAVTPKWRELPKNVTQRGSKQDLYFLNGSYAHLEHLKVRTNMGADSDLESVDDASSDAVGSLSPAESRSLSCDLSCLSGSNGLDSNHSRGFSVDMQTRDIMMKRFLPAAKAMANFQAPHHASRMQFAASEPLQQEEKETCGELRPSEDRYVSNSNTLQPYLEEAEENDSEDEDFDDITFGKSVRACGLIRPQFSLRNSLCLLNALPGLKSRTDDSKPAHIRSKKTSKLHTRDVDYKSSFVRDIRPLEPAELKLRLPVTRSCLLNYSSDSNDTVGSFPYRQSRSGAISPYRNFTPRPPISLGGRFLGVPKKVENFKVDMRSDSPTTQKSEDLIFCRKNCSGPAGPVIPAAEKTVYIDPVNIFRASESHSRSSDNNGFEALGARKRMAEKTTTATDDIERMKALIKERAMAKLCASVPNGLLRGHELEQGLGSLDCFEKPAGEETCTGNEQTHMAKLSGKYNICSMASVVPPPLPKSPSESWLLRTLPSLPHQSSHPHNGSQSHAVNKVPETTTTAGTTKWETIVKTSKSHHDHVRYSEELTSTNVSQLEARN